MCHCFERRKEDDAGGGGGNGDSACREAKRSLVDVLINPIQDHLTWGSTLSRSTRGRQACRIGSGGFLAIWGDVSPANAGCQE